MSTDDSDDQGTTMDYLSPTWLDTAGRIVGALGPTDDQAEPPVMVEITYRIEDAPNGPVAYRVTRTAAGVEWATLGPSVSTDDTGRPELRAELRMDYDTACSIARGERNAARAFLDGDVRLGGASDALLAAAPLLRHIGDGLGDLRSRTRYP